MITFKSPEDLNKLSPDDPAYPTVEELVDQLITAYSPPGRPYPAFLSGSIEKGCFSWHNTCATKTLRPGRKTAL